LQTIEVSRMPRVTKAAAEPVASPSVVTTTVTLPPKDEKTAAEKPRLDFWSQIAASSPQDWGSRQVVYLYRTRPVVGMSTREKYLDVLSKPFTIEDIRARFGGEEFKAMLIRDGKCVQTEVFAIEAAPKFDPRETPGSGAAQAGALERVMEKLIDREREASEGENLTNKAAEQAIDLVTKGYETVLTKTASHGSSNGQSNDNDLVKVLLLKLLDRNPMKEMLEGIQAAQAMGLIPKAGEATSPVSVLGQVKEVLGLVKELGGEFGGPRRGGGGIAEVIMDKAPDLLEKVVEGLGKYSEVKARENEALQIKANAATRIAAINRGAQAPAQPEIPQAMPGGAPRAAMAANPGLGIGETSGANGGAGSLDLEPVGTMSAATSPTRPFNPQTGTVPEAEAFLFNYFKSRVVQLIAEGANGEDMVQFAQDFDPRIFTVLESADAEGLRKFFAEDPILRSALALPRWAEFFAEACNDLYGATVPAKSVEPN
jgi:hypothetical protein